MRVKQTLEALGVRPSKERGQNFIINEAVLDQIIAFGAPSPGENLVEIGPGLGALTERLYQVAPLRVIEIESRFCDELRVRFPKLTVVCADARSVDFATLGSDLVVFGNLPYSFSSAILFTLIDNAPHLSRAILLLQQEFVERMVASPGGRDYGTLSIGCQLWAELRAGPVISGECFHPPTQVQSQLVELVFRRQPRVALPDPKWFRAVVQAAFSQRRKMLRNSLRSSGRWSDEQVLAGLAQAGIDATRRAETVSIDEYAALAAALRDVKS